MKFKKKLILFITTIYFIPKKSQVSPRHNYKYFFGKFISRRCRHVRQNKCYENFLKLTLTLEGDSWNNPSHTNLKNS